MPKPIAGMPSAVKVAPPALKRAKLVDLVCFTGVMAASRLALRSHYLYDLDSVNFALALRKSDVAVHQPHPPGYFLYVCLGRLFLRFFPDPNTALVAISILASCGFVVLLYFLTDQWFGRRAARWAGLLLLVSPLAWFHGIVALTYIVEGFLSACLGYLCWQAWSGRAGFVAPSALLFAASVGFRQSSALLLGPLWLLSLRRARRREAAWGLVVLGVSVLAWLIPMLIASGGVERYWTSLHGLWTLVPGRQNALAGFFASTVARIFVILGILLFCFGVSALLVSVDTPSFGRDAHRFLLAWIAPALLFFSLVFLKSVNSGYLLIVTPPLFAWMGAKVAAWMSTPVRRAVALAGAGVNTALFLFAPFYCSYRSVRQVEGELASIPPEVRRLADPRDTLVVSFDSHFLGFRHAAYYLPEYLTLEYPAARFPYGRRIFAARDRNTLLLEQPPTQVFRNFVIFPLPDEPSFHEYLREFARSFPGGRLESRTSGTRSYLVGRAEDLPVLFPNR